MYAKGRGVRQDYKAAADWYRKAADQGNPNAQTNLGVLYAEGRGVPRDDTVASTWFRKAADQGNGRAQYNLGIIYSNGGGFLHDDTAAEHWFRKAADQGVPGAEKKAEETRRLAQEREGKRRAREEARRRGEELKEEIKTDGPDWWVVLGVEPNATIATAKRAYRAKMKESHPDKVVLLAPQLVELAEQRTRELNAAMEEAERYWGTARSKFM
jgi:TPR repeat protein